MRKLAFCSTLLLLYTVSFTHAKIVFVSAQEICVMDDDGSNIQKLTHNNVYDSTPRWSPNGKYIAFIRAQERVTNEQNHDIFIMNRDGSNTKQLTYYTGLDGQPTSSLPS